MTEVVNGSGHGVSLSKAGRVRTLYGVNFPREYADGPDEDCLLIRLKRPERGRDFDLTFIGEERLAQLGQAIQLYFAQKAIKSG